MTSFSAIPVRMHSAPLAAAVAGVGVLLLTACSDSGRLLDASRTAGERKAAAALEAALANPLELRAFLFRMPKGADLHNHLSGAVYAESWLRAAKEDGLLIDRSSSRFVKPPTGEHEGQHTKAGKGSVSDACPPDLPATPIDINAKMPDGKPRYMPAASIYRDQHQFDAFVDLFSMRNFVASSGNTAHDHFFDTFGKLPSTDRSHLGEWVQEVAVRAAAQNEQYLELMHTPKPSGMSDIVKLVEKDVEDVEHLDPKPILPIIGKGVGEARQELDRIEATRRRLGHCGQREQMAACKVEVRYIYQVSRGKPKCQVLASTLFGFALASADPRVVGINFVMPEDGTFSMLDYATHMRYVRFFHALYPKVRIALHAGELAPGLVPPEGLCCHIRKAIEAGAERIGHGVDIMYETGPYDGPQESPYELLDIMAKKHVMVEINLSSNDLILGIVGDKHPFPIYRKHAVPVALSTDDEGISRIDLTHEYVRAVQAYGLHYADLKQIVRTSLEHSFLPGTSLWKKPDQFAAPVAACADDRLGSEKPSSPCSDFLEANERAREQWELERRFVAFEATFH